MRELECIWGNGGSPPSFLLSLPLRVEENIVHWHLEAQSFKADIQHPTSGGHWGS